MSDQYIIHLRRVRTVEGAAAWEAWHPRLPGCSAQGETPAQAQDALDKVRCDYLQELADGEQPVPLGDTTLGHRVVIYVH